MIDLAASMSASRMNAHRTLNMTMANNRGLKLLGLRVVDIINTLFPRDGVNMHQGQLIRTEFFGFWSQLSATSNTDNDNVTKYYRALLDQLLRWLRNKDKEWTSTIPLNSLINTIAFMTISAPFRINTEAIVQFYDDYNHPSREASKYQDPPAVRNLVRLLAARANLDKSDDYISPLVLGASSLLPSTRLAEIIERSTVDESDIQSNEYGFLYTYLLELIQTRGVDFQLSVMQSILDRMTIVLNQSKINQLNAEVTYNALLYMLDRFLHTDAISITTFLRKCVTTLQPFFCWAQPFSDLTRNVINRLQNELLSPGHNHRNMLLRECSVVDYAGLGCEREPGYRFVKPLFYLYDVDDPSCGSTLNIIDTSLYKKEYLVQPLPSAADPTGGAVPPIGVLALSILQAMAIDVEVTDDDIALIKTLNQSQLYGYFQRIHAFDTLMRNRSHTQQTREDRMGEMLKLKNELVEFAEQNIQTTQNYSRTPLFHLPPTNEFQNLHTPSFPQSEHLRVPISLKSKYDDSYACQGTLDSLLDIITSYQQDSSWSLGMASSPGSRLPSPPPIPDPISLNSSDARRGSQPFVQHRPYAGSVSLSSTHSAAPSTSVVTSATPGTPANTPQRELRFIIIGNDVLLQHIVSAYYILRNEYSHLLTGLKIHWYLAPTTRNHLAGYLARYDFWYHRHIFFPLRYQSLLVPWLRESESDIRSNNEGLPCYPTVFLRQCLEQYTQFANQQLNARVYILEGFRDRAMSRHVDEVIPFVQRVEIGARPAAEDYRLSKNYSSIEDVYKDKNFTYSSIDLCVKYSKIDLCGTQKAEVIDDTIPYVAALISNVPRKVDPCHPPDPTAPGVEIFAQAHSRVDRSRARNNTLLFDPRQHVSEVTFTSFTSRFKVLVDGALYGPFSSVRISSAFIKLPNAPATTPTTTSTPVASAESSQVQQQLSCADDTVEPSISRGHESSHTHGDDFTSTHTDSTDPTSQERGGMRKYSAPSTQKSSAIIRELPPEGDKDNDVPKEPFVFSIQSFFPIITTGYSPDDPTRSTLGTSSSTLLSSSSASFS